MKNIHNIGTNSKIITYEGKEGLLQVTKNSLEAKKDLYIYEMAYASLNEFLSKDEAEKIRKDFLKKNVKIKEITNVAYHEKYTVVKEFHQKCMEIRYINPDKLNITTEFLTYNDVVAFYTFKNGFFAVEIYNKDLAKLQQQIFNFAWNIAEKPMIGKSGKTSLF